MDITAERPDQGLAPSRLGAELAGLLETRIRAGEQPAGTLLPSERALSAQYGISRATVRQALSELEAKHLIARRQGRGTTVLGPPSEAADLASLLAATPPEVRNAIELRRIVEPEIARLAAQRALPSDLVLLRRALETTSEHLDPEESVRRDVEFHHLLARASRNPLLPALMEFAAAQTEGERLASHRTVDRRRTSLAGHRAILEAVRTGDAEAARAAMDAHLAEVQEISTPGR